MSKRLALTIVMSVFFICYILAHLLFFNKIIFRPKNFAVYLPNKQRGVSTFHIETLSQEQQQVNLQFQFKDVVDFLKFRVQLADVLNLTASTYGSNETCMQIIAGGSRYWRSVTNESFTADNDHSRMTLAVNCGGQRVPEYMMTPPKPKWYDFEREYLTDKPVTNVKMASSEVFSTVRLLNSSTAFVVGDVIALEVIIKDGYGYAKAKGGDEIRAWLKDIKRDSKMAAQVSDFNNGTYLITAVLPWQGRLRIFIELTYTREHFTALLTSHLLIKGFQQTIGGFVNDNANEATPCFNAPVLPGYSSGQICDLTSQNGSPWFCGRPVKEKLTCQDYKHTRLLVNNADAPLLPTELAILQSRRYGLIGESHPIIIDVSAPANWSQQTQLRIIPSIPCHEVPARDTWEQPEPTGYFYYNHGWQSLQCNPSMDYDMGCRNDVEIIMLGDSNVRGHYYSAADSIPCDHVLKAAYEKWHKPLKCVDSEHNVTLRWLPHSNPFKTYATQWADPLNDLVPSNLVIDTIPATGRYIVVLNHFLHITGQHISAYMDTMIAIKESLLKTFERNPNIVVVLQGPHIVMREGSYRGGDMLNRFIKLSHMEVFKDLRDKVVYYQVSDMSVASRNQDTHPETYVVRNWTKYLFAMICNRGLH